MPDKTISELTPVSTVNNNDLFVLEQNSEAKKMTGQQLLNFTSVNIVSASATTLNPGQSATATYNTSTHALTLGIPKGAKGDPGQDGQGAPSSTTPKMDGTAAVGSETNFARGDHRHPTDTSRASASSLTTHTSSTNNPHNVTAAQVGADPSGTASAAVTAHLAVSNPHSVTPAMIGAMPYIVQLWKNTNAQVAFDPTTISLPVLANYDAVLIFFNANANDNRRTSQIVMKDGLGHILVSCQEGGNTIRTRRCYVTSSGVQFEDGYNGNTTVANASCVPAKIFGIKGFTFM